MLRVGVDLILETFKSTLLCTVQLVVQSVLSVLDAATAAVAAAVHDAAQALHALLQGVIAAAQGATDLGADGMNAVLRVFGTHVNAPTLQAPAVFKYVAFSRQGAGQCDAAPGACAALPRPADGASERG